MLAYKDLSKEEQEEILNTLEQNAEYELLIYVKRGDVCCRCYMIYYNCLCSHGD
jgi:hypothetical protein